MTVTTHTCVSITCDDCNEDANLYEDMGTAHYESVEEARKALVDHDDGDEFRWSVDGNHWRCPSCAAAKACKDAGGHDWGPWDAYGSTAFRTCRRGHCQRSERRPIETAGGGL